MDEDDEGDEAECFLHFYLDGVALDDDGMLGNHGGHGGAREGERESKEREQVEEWVGERERSRWVASVVLLTTRGREAWRQDVAVGGMGTGHCGDSEEEDDVLAKDPLTPINLFANRSNSTFSDLFEPLKHFQKLWK